MKSYEAIARVCGGVIQDVAKRLRVSTRRIYQFMEAPTDFDDPTAATGSGTINPLDHIDDMIDVAEKADKPVADKFAPIFFLAQGRGVFLPLPANRCDLREVAVRANRAMKEVGDLFAEFGEGMQDGRISPIEARRIAKEGHEAIAAITEAIAAAEVAAKSGEG